MEPRTSERLRLTQEEVEAVRDQHKGEILSNQQVIDLLSGPESLDLHKVTQWLGYGIEKRDAPINRFSDIIRDDYPKLSQDERLQFLRGASRFVILGEKQSFRFSHVRYIDLLDRRFEGAVVVQMGHKLDEGRVVSNVGELLSKTLEFCNGDLEEARNILRYEGMHSVSTRSEMRKHALGEFFDPLPDSPHKRRVRPFIEKSPKLRELAFLLVVDTGDFSPGNSSFPHLLTSVYTRADGRIKTRIMEHVANVIFARSVSTRAMRDVNYFISTNLGLYQTVKAKLPSSPFVRAYERAREAISFINLLEKTKGGRIDAEGLVDILEKNPTLVADVTREELELALNSTKDHRVAMKLEGLIRAKSKSSL